MARRAARRATPKEGPYISTERARKRPGKTVKPGGTKVIKAKGKKPLAFKAGGLHATTGTPQGQKIPASKLAAAKAGKYGEKGKKQYSFYVNVLKKGQRTAKRGK